MKFFILYSERAYFIQVATICMHWCLFFSGVQSIDRLGEDESYRFGHPEAWKKVLCLLSSSLKYGYQMAVKVFRTW